jgi:hypothetical protein
MDGMSEENHSDDQADLNSERCSDCWVHLQVRVARRFGTRLTFNFSGPRPWCASPVADKIQPLTDNPGRINSGFRHLRFLFDERAHAVSVEICSHESGKRRTDCANRRTCVGMVCTRIRSDLADHRRINET